MKKSIILFLVFLICLPVTPVLAKTEVKVPIILYHHIVEKMEEDTDIIANITAETIEGHFKALAEKGYNAITFEEYLNFRNGKGTLPKNPIIITFDDGYESNYTYAYPLLKKYGLKATIFVVTSTVGVKDGSIIPHFSWEEAREMEESGVVDIFAHSHTHRDLTTLTRAEMQKEFRLSKFLVETNLDKECNIFAYPYGAHNADIIFAASQANYSAQVLLGNSGYNTKETDPHFLRRITVWGSITPEKLLVDLMRNLAM